MRSDPAGARLKAVLDTNIYVAAFTSPTGKSAAVWNAARRGRYDLFASPAIIREMAEVLRFDFAWETTASRRRSGWWRGLPKLSCHPLC